MNYENLKHIGSANFGSAGAFLLCSATVLRFSERNYVLCCIVGEMRDGKSAARGEY